MRAIGIRNEITSGSKLKLEFDEYTKEMRLDRIVPIPYPANYGYAPGTLAADGDPIDVFVLGEPLPPGIMTVVVPVAAIEYLDGGVQDPKIVAIVKGAEMPTPEALEDKIAEIKQFLRAYKAGGEVLDIETDPWLLLRQSYYAKAYGEADE